MTIHTAKASPLLGEHHSLSATFTDFAGWQMPIKYSSELAEHRAVRQTAGIFDISHMGEILVEGRVRAQQPSPRKVKEVFDKNRYNSTSHVFKT